MLDYEKKLKYFDYLENGAKKRTAGFVKIERKWGILRYTGFCHWSGRDKLSEPGNPARVWHKRGNAWKPVHKRGERKPDIKAPEQRKIMRDF